MRTRLVIITVSLVLVILGQTSCSNGENASAVKWVDLSAKDGISPTLVAAMQVVPVSANSLSVECFPDIWGVQNGEEVSRPFHPYPEIEALFATDFEHFNFMAGATFETVHQPTVFFKGTFDSDAVNSSLDRSSIGVETYGGTEIFNIPGEIWQIREDVGYMFDNGAAAALLGNIAILGTPAVVKDFIDVSLGVAPSLMTDTEFSDAAAYIPDASSYDLRRSPYTGFGTYEDIVCYGCAMQYATDLDIQSWVMKFSSSQSAQDALSAIQTDISGHWGYLLTQPAIALTHGGEMGCVSASIDRTLQRD